MNLRSKLLIDHYLGSFLLNVLRPFALLLGKTLQRNHSIQIKKDILYIKIVGGGSLLLAFESIYSLKQKHPNVKFKIIVGKATYPFAKLMNVFEEVYLIDDSSIMTMCATTMRAITKNLFTDTIIELELYSKITAAIALLTLARNRIGFFNKSASIKRHINTHQIYYNRSGGVWNPLESISYFLGVEKILDSDAMNHFKDNLELTESFFDNHVAIGPYVSELGRERELTNQQWIHFLRLDQKIKSVHILGGPSDIDRSKELEQMIKSELPQLEVTNHVGKLNIKESIHIIYKCQNYWGADSALLHIARLLSIPTKSFWGPTNPNYVLKNLDQNRDQIHYIRLACSPCVHVTTSPPCNGDNICIKNLTQEQVRNKYWVIK